VNGEFARDGTDETLRGVARALELRDVAGSLVPTDFIELVECSPRPVDGRQRATFVGAFVRLRTAPAGVVAAASPRLGEPLEYSPPAT
jgi:hypothetical protein